MVASYDLSTMCPLSDLEINILIYRNQGDVFAFVIIQNSNHTIKLIHNGHFDLAYPHAFARPKVKTHCDLIQQKVYIS